MTDMELADLIERKGVLNAVQSIAGTERKIIAALRREHEPWREPDGPSAWPFPKERPPSGEMMMVPREPWFSVRHIEFVCHTLPSHKEHETVAVAPSDLRGLRDTAFAWIYAYTSLGCEPNSAERMVQAEIASYLSAAEAEGRKG